MVALKLKQVFEKHGFSVAMEEIIPVMKLKEYEYEKLPKIELENSKLDVSGYDLIVIGSPVWSFFPSPVVTTFIRKLENTKKKNFALFCTCVVQGNVIKRMSNLLTTKGAKIIDSLTIRSIFEVDKKKLKDAEIFAENIIQKLNNV